MRRPPVLVHLIGFPGVGKLTIAREMERVASDAGGHPDVEQPAAEQRVVVVDNHLTANTIFAVIETDGVRTLPDEVWDHVGAVREVVFGAMERLSPPGWSFILTNVLLADDPAEEASVRRIAALAAARRSRYVPVRLHCDDEEHRRRVASPERRDRQKWIDPDAVGRFAAENDLVRIDLPELLDLDVTHRSPRESATRIWDHVDGCPG